jgi:hypothetical protein
MTEDDAAPASPFAQSGGAFLAATLGTVSDNPRVDQLLDRQVALADLQIENLRKLDDYETSHLRWRRFNDQMRGVLQLMAAAVAAVIVVAIATALWNAAHDDGVVIEAFSVPPDLAAKGLTGEVVATQLQDKIAALQSATFSYRSPASYANNWGDNIKVQIPDTGVSIGEFNRYLRSWLGHETHITGEVWRTMDGIAVTARAGSDVSPAFTGKESDLDKLIQSAAESVYRSTQPYRYAIYLFDQNRPAEAKPVLRALIRGGSQDERAWAHIGLAQPATLAGDTAGEAMEYRRAIAEQPRLTLAYNDLTGSLLALGDDEGALTTGRKALALGAGVGGAAINPFYAKTYVLSLQSGEALALGDYPASLAFNRQIEAMEDRATWEFAFSSDLVDCGSLHDAACVRQAQLKFADMDGENPYALGYTQLSRLGYLAAAQAALGDWAASAASDERAIAGLNKLGNQLANIRDRAAIPLLALDQAHLGNIAKAQALIGSTPLHCEACLLARGIVDALAKNRAGAAYWFARADAFAPSFPFVDTEWGRMLLATGDADGAVAKFKIAHQRSPHFADPLEMWGEALMLQNYSDLALAKFVEAAGYAPNWGRLHLKWGEALFYADKKADAAKQFALALSLYLTADEKAELARMKAAHGG